MPQRRPDHPWEHHDDRLPIDPDLAPDDPGEPSLLHHPGAHLHRSRHLDVAAIASGGFLGTLARYELGLAWPTPAGGFPWTTLAINTSGAFLLGLILTVLLERIRPTRYLRPFFCVGVLGAWTTMSGVAVDADLLFRSGRALTAVAYLLATVGAGVAVSWIGITLGRTVDVRRPQWVSR